MRFEDKIAKLRIEKHDGRETSEFLVDVKKLCDGEAIEYLLGQVDFCDAKVDLSLRPMIPRPETEFWVREAIEEMNEGLGMKDEEAREQVKPVRVLDIFSGSGCVGLAVLKNIPNSNVTFIELAPHLKEQIEISIKKNKFDENRIEVLTGDTFDPLARSFLALDPARKDPLGVIPMKMGIQVKNLKNTDLDPRFREDDINTEHNNKFDYIFAVPPYVPPQMKDEVMKELTAETPLCFFDKEDGFFYIKKVLNEVRNYLNIRGELFIEFDITQREKIEELIKENKFENYSFLKDPYGHECVVRIKMD